MEFVLEIIIYFIFMYPGAAIRWLISRLWNSKKTFKEFAEDDAYLNGGTGIFFLAVVMISVKPLFE
ncbi:hypothetical protein [Pontibacter pamirensis]|uniref:hypothetical protein n=1 Tax=Pontibacter pamirensis TaxID=2562824 RepID=UPI00138A35BE|nr:hypothetical protein [Pontibacter pamirensis]